MALLSISASTPTLALRKPLAILLNFSIFNYTYIIPYYNSIITKRITVVNNLLIQSKFFADINLPE